MKGMFKPIGIFVAITFVATLLLALGNYFFKIEEEEEVKGVISANMQTAIRTLVDDEEAEIKEINYEGISLHSKVVNVYKITSGEKEDAVIMRTQQTADKYGNVEMLTAINSDDDKIIKVAVWSNDTDKGNGVLKNFDYFSGKVGSELDFEGIDYVSQATKTAEAFFNAVKLGYNQYSANKTALLNAPLYSGSVMDVTYEIQTDMDNIQAGNSVVVVFTVVSSKVNVNELTYDVTVTKDGETYTNITKVLPVDGSGKYKLTIKNIQNGIYTASAKFSKGKYTADSKTITFEIDFFEDYINTLLEVAEEYQDQTAIDKTVEQENGIIVYNVNYYDGTQNHNITVYGIKNYDYIYGKITIILTFGGDGKIDKIYGVKVDYDDNEGTLFFDKDKELSGFIGENGQTGVINVTGATSTSNAVNSAVELISDYYLSLEG